MVNSDISANSKAPRLIAIAGWSALLVTVILQWRAISQLRHENETLRAQQQQQPEDRTEDAMAPQSPAIDIARLQEDQLELLRLRNEVRQLREQTSPPPAGAGLAASASAQRISPPIQSLRGEAQQLGVAALQGDSSALDRLADLVAAAGAMGPEEKAAVRSDIQEVFDMLGTEAGRGNAAGLRALWQASRIGELQGFAVRGLGRAAALGNEEALEPLLDPERYLLLRSSTTSALQPAADAGNERAIQALARTAADPKQQALWYMTAHGLEKAAGAGNASAIDGLARIAASTNQASSKQAVLALEAAARKNQPRAEEALRSLGWR